jgi:hypothetical protein
MKCAADVVLACDREAECKCGFCEYHCICGFDDTAIHDSLIKEMKDLGYKIPIDIGR